MYSDAPITYQWSKYRPTDSINCSAPLTENRGGLSSFGRLVGDHRYLWIEINENRLLGFRQHDIIPPTKRKLCLVDLNTINKFNDTPHKIFVKHGMYQKIHYIHNRSIYPHPTHLSWAFEILDKLIIRLMNTEDKKHRRKITGRVKWSLKYKEAMDLVELWVLLNNQYEKHR